MDAQLKAKWVEALRSGEIKQGEGMLHDKKNDAYCCLGVLCKVMGATFGPAEEVREDEEGFPVANQYDYVPTIEGRILSSRDDEELAVDFCKEIGIPDQSALILLNDGRGRPDDKNYAPSRPFTEIADYIETNIPADAAVKDAE